MTSAEDLLDALNCTIRFTTPEGDYEGILKRVFAESRMITVVKTHFLNSNIKLGTLNFMLHEVSNIKLLTQPNIPREIANENSLIYFHSDIDSVFNLDGDSESESESNADKISKEEKGIMKLLPCFSKWMSTDSQIIDSFDNEFSLAVKRISDEYLVGVSLEGPKISRNGILTWVCISTAECTYLFDILALGEKSFQNGLKSILENSKIKKIFHDCRLASDCLFHMYNVRLVNVFDTQVADSLVLMQESKNCSIVKQVNSLDTCLTYYLQLPDDYLYSPLAFNLDKKSIYYHGLRPLRENIRNAMIKNVVYLQILKRELETALLTPLRRAIDVYLNVIQNATDRELMVAPPILDELPPELLLEGIQIVRYQQHEYIPPIVSSGPPLRKLVNPIKDFVESCKRIQTRHENKCLPSHDIILQNEKPSECSVLNISNETCKSSSQSSNYFSKGEYSSCETNKDKTFSVNEFNNIKDYVPFPPDKDFDSFHIAKSFETEMSQNASMGAKTTFNKTQSVFGDISLKAEPSNDEKNYGSHFTDQSVEIDNYQGKKHAAGNICIAVDIASPNTTLLGNNANEIVKVSPGYQNEQLSKNKYKVSNPVGNCLLRTFNETPCKNLGSAKSSIITSEQLTGNSTMCCGQEKNLNAKPDWGAFWNEIRKECITQQSNCKQNYHRPKLRFVPAGMTLL